MGKQLDELGLDFAPERVGKPQAIEYLDKMYRQMEQMAIERPGPDQALSEYDVLHWQRRFMAYWGQVIGTLRCMGDFGILPIDMCQQYKLRFQLMLQRLMAAVTIGEA